MNQGLADAAKQLQSYGRGPDTMLAHISPDEAHFIDYLQGGTKTNPQTGLPEYSLFGKILKSVARAAGAIVGFSIAGPAGAAMGAGLTTKATGGSWNDALKGAALSGLGSYAVQGLTGGGWSPTGAGAPIANAAAASGYSAALPSTLGGLGATAMSAPGLAAGVGAVAGKDAEPAAAPIAPLPQQSININALPLSRGYTPYQGDYAHYGETAGPHSFFKNVNPLPQYAPVAAAPVAAEAQQEAAFKASGGRVRARMRGLY